jgi:hypothetical protein
MMIGRSGADRLWTKRKSGMTGSSSGVIPRSYRCRKDSIEGDLAWELIRQSRDGLTITEENGLVFRAITEQCTEPVG